MSVAIVKAVLERFITQDRPQVLIIDGAWGVGKTHLWRSVVGDLAKDANPSRYAYVSLFGLASAKDLREAVVLKLKPLAPVKNEKFSFFSGARDLYFKNKDLFASIPYLKNVSIGIDALSSYVIRDAIICIDDFERLNGSLIAPEEVLGFISEIKEERNCKVVLIMNSGELAEPQVLARYREKVVDLDLLLDPGSTEAVAIAIPEDTLNRDLIVDCCLNLGIRNIRILRKIYDLCVIATQAFGHFHEQVVKQAIASIVLFSWSYFDRSEDRITLDHIKSWNRYSTYLTTKEKRVVSEQEKRWDQILQKYNFGAVDEFDLCLIKFIEHGYLDGTGAVESADELDRQTRRFELEAKLGDAWKIFRASFNDDEDEFLEKIYAATRNLSEYISPANLDSSVSILREFGRNELADDLINQYVAAQRNFQKAPFDWRAGVINRDLRDNALKDRLDAELAKVRAVPTLRETLLKIWRERGWGEENQLALRAATEDDYYKLFKGETEFLSGLIATALSDLNEPAPTPREKATEALRRIGKESRLNQARLVAYLKD